VTTATGNVRGLLRTSASYKLYKRNWLHSQRTQLQHNSTTPLEAFYTVPTLSKLLRRELRLIQGNLLAQRKPTVIVYHACLENPPSVGRILATATSFERRELPLDGSPELQWYAQEILSRASTLTAITKSKKDLGGDALWCSRTSKVAKSRLIDFFS
jgi:hypothetical protein